METELNKNQDKYRAFKASAIICLIALVLSFAGCGSSSESAKNAAKSNSASSTIVKGSENIPRISIKGFFTNIGKNTGIYKLIHTETAEEKAALEAQEAAVKAAESIDPFAGKTVPGWQSFVMMAIGFLIVYLAVAKGFEPLLLIPIGFGTILVNIPGAGMGDAPHGMLHIIYSAGVGNEFFPMLIFMGIGAMTDFGPLIANKKTMLLGAASCALESKVVTTL